MNNIKVILILLSIALGIFCIYDLYSKVQGVQNEKRLEILKKQEDSVRILLHIDSIKSISAANTIRIVDSMLAINANKKQRQNTQTKNNDQIITQLSPSNDSLPIFFGTRTK